MSSTENSLLEQLARHAELDFESGRMLPVESYRSELLLSKELRLLFGREWLCVGRTADVAKPGDYFSAEVPSVDGHQRSIIIVRGEDGVLRAFDNVCIHRGARLLEGSGNEARVTCPYHAWVYRLDGSLTGGPYMSESCEADGSPFDPGRHRLVDLPLEVWEGFIFIDQSGDAKPLAPELQGLTEVVSPFRMAGYVPVHSEVGVWETNWKLLVENFMDAYHVFKVHKNSFGANGDNTRFTTMIPGTERWAHHQVVNPDDEDLAHPDNDVLRGPARKMVVLAAVFPGFVIQLQPDWLWFLQITPIGTERVRVAWQVAVAPELLAGSPDRVGLVAEIMDLVNLVNSEDKPIVEGIRRSMNGQQFPRGPLSYLERNVYDFDRYISNRLTGADSTGAD